MGVFRANARDGEISVKDPDQQPLDVTGVDAVLMLQSDRVGSDTVRKLHRTLMTGIRDKLLESYKNGIKRGGDERDGKKEPLRRLSSKR